MRLDCRILLFLGSLSLLLLQTSGASAAEQRLKLLELFTSQGCSSCPAADKLLGELAGRRDVLALSFHVDYWDYLGWKDPFASTANTQRQRDYARLLSSHYVYTPQLIVQGTAQVAGNDRAAVLQAIEQASTPVVPINLAWYPPDRLEITFASSIDQTPADVWLAGFDHSHMTMISAGENRGRKLSNFNIVRDLSIVGHWDGQPSTMTAVVDVERWQAGGCAVFVQRPGTGAILGAARCGP